FQWRGAILSLEFSPPSPRGLRPGRSCALGTGLLRAALEVGVKGVVEERSPLDDFVVVGGHVRKPLADCPEPDRLRRLRRLFGEVRVMDDPRQVSQGRVAGQALLDELLEGAAALPVLVGIAGSGCVKADRPFPLLDGRDVAGLDEDDLRRRVEEALDQPGRRGAIDVNPLARYPLHAVMVSAAT